MKLLLTSAILCFVFSSAYSQKTYIPDPNFENALIFEGIDDVLDDSVLTSAIDTLTFLDLEPFRITDLTGIEAFTSLASLNCANNNISNLDVSSNTSLNYLFCTANNLSVIDVSSNLALTHLHCALNNLTVLDVSNNSALISLQCDRNSLTELDVSTNTALTEVWSFSNNLSVFKSLITPQRE